MFAERQSGGGGPLYTCKGVYFHTSLVSRCVPSLRRCDPLSEGGHLYTCKGASDHCPIVMESSFANYLESSKKKEATPITTCNTKIQQGSGQEVMVIKVPVRVKKVVKINVLATSLREGYISRIPAKDGIYLGKGGKG